MKILTVAMAASLLVSGCDRTPQTEHKTAAAAPKPADPNARFAALRFTDAPPPANTAPLPAPLAAEVALDRAGFSPGVIDGKWTRTDEAALRGFQTAKGLSATGKLDPATTAQFGGGADAVRTVRIPRDFAKGPFAPDLPTETAKQAAFPYLAYRNLPEALAERFHTTPETIAALNPPGTPLVADAVIRVPNIADVDPATLGPDERGWNTTLMTLGVSPRQPQADRVVVSKSAGTLQAFDAAGKLLVQFPVTTGSEHDPLPLGTWKVLGVSRNPDYHFNPALFWDARDDQPDRLLKPGPNGPVGVVWIDLSKEHYGIHGTGEPASIGRSESHGCVRLTNWNAAQLAQMVKPGVAVEFKP